MRDIIHKLLLLCGSALVVLRFVPAKPGGFLSKLFFDEVVHNRIGALSTKVFLSLGVTIDQYQSRVAQLASLSHVVALIVEAMGMALTVFINTRRI
jgi:hypothetical protein